MTEQKKVELTLLRLGSWPGMLIYLGIGALLHALMIGPQFDWQSAWTWGWLLGWPIALFIAFWAFILGALVLGCAIALCVVGWEAWSDRRQRKEFARLAKAARERRGA